MPSFSFLDPNYDVTSEEKPAGHPGGRALHRAGRQRAHAIAAVAQDGPVHHLGRARWLLRPCASAQRAARARQHQLRSPTQPRCRTRTCHCAPGGYGRYGFRVPLFRRLALGARQLRVQRRSRTTPRSWPSSSASGTCRHSACATPMPHPMTDYFDFTRAGIALPFRPRWRPRPPWLLASRNARQASPVRDATGSRPPSASH